MRKVGVGVDAEDGPPGFDGARGVRPCPLAESGVVLRVDCTRAALAISFARYAGLNASCGFWFAETLRAVLEIR